MAYIQRFLMPKNIHDLFKFTGREMKAGFSADFDIGRYVNLGKLRCRGPSVQRCLEVGIKTYWRGKSSKMSSRASEASSSAVAQRPPRRKKLPMPPRFSLKGCWV